MPRPASHAVALVRAAPSWMDTEDKYKGQIGTELTRIVAQMLVLGGVLGLGAGFCVRSVLRRVYNDKFVEASVLLGSSYLVFWLGELVMSSSAVIAVVVMGLYMNYHKESFSPDGEEGQVL